MQKGYAYASQNKGVLNFQVASFASLNPPTGDSCRLNPPSQVWVSFYDDAPAKPFTQWTQYIIDAAQAARLAVKGA